VTKFGSASRRDIDQLLWDKLSDALDEDKKRNKIRGLLNNLSSSDAIRDAGPCEVSTWRIAEKCSPRRRPCLRPSMTVALLVRLPSPALLAWIG